MKSTTKAVLSYLVLWVSGIVMLVVEKEDEFVRKNAAQSFVLFLALTIVSAVLGWIPILGGIISAVIGIVSLVLWLVLMFMAWNNSYLRIPVVADISEKFVLKLFK